MILNTVDVNRVEIFAPLNKLPIPFSCWKFNLFKLTKTCEQYPKHYLKRSVRGFYSHTGKDFSIFEIFGCLGLAYTCHKGL